jgi:peptide/nickel transport system substrate-binding protein
MRVTALGKLALALVSLVAAACATDKSGGAGGTVIVATASDATNLLPPFAADDQSLAISDQLYDKLADTGPGLNTVGDGGFLPRLAKSWNWSSDSLSIRFHIDTRARWHDGQPVRASDIRFTWQVYADSLVNSTRRGDVVDALDSVTVADSLTAVVWFKRRTPEQFYNLVVTMVPIPEHVLARVPRDSLESGDAGRHPVGSGPFRFVRWSAGERIEIAAVDSFYRERAKLDRVIWTITPEMPSAVQKLFAGEADFLEALPPASAADVARHPDVRTIATPPTDYGYLEFNEFDGATNAPNKIFSSREVRRALTMALDRRSMVRNVLDSLGTVSPGPFVATQWSADSTLNQIPFDRARAMRILDSLGWRAGSGGVRTRAGVPLSFGLMVPSSSTNRKRFAELIQAELKDVGALVFIESVDRATFSARVGGRKFDTNIGGTHTTPSPSGLRQTWTTTAIKAKSPFNAGRYSSPAFDAQVDSATTATDQTLAKVHYSKAYQVLLDDAPAAFLYSPITVAGANKRLVTGPLRADAWWKTLDRWSIAPGGRLPRDAAPAKP